MSNTNTAQSTTVAPVAVDLTTLAREAIGAKREQSDGASRMAAVKAILLATCDASDHPPIVVEGEGSVSFRDASVGADVLDRSKTEKRLRDARCKLVKLARLVGGDPKALALVTSLQGLCEPVFKSGAKRGATIVVSVS